MAENRLAREIQTRSASERPKAWQRPETLPQPNKEPGYAYRWIRVALLNQNDAKNVSAKYREGWEPVQIEEQPQFKMLVDPNSRFKDNVEVAGLLLCKMPEEFVDQRTAYFAKMTKDNMDAVDNNFMRENDARMPLFKEKKSSTSFGQGR
jgi:hypothetical protein